MAWFCPESVMPPAQILAPIWVRRSHIRTVLPFSARIFAALKPPGPAPMMMVLKWSEVIYVERVDVSVAELSPVHNITF